MDSVPTLMEVGALCAFSQCLVERMSRALEVGEPIDRLPYWFMRENKWRAARYGMDALIITDAGGTEELVTDVVERWLVRLAPVAERLGCAAELAEVRTILHKGASYQRQRAVARRNGGELDAVVASLVAEMRAGRPL